jgi:hypothetical protein
LHESSSPKKEQSAAVVAPVMLAMPAGPANLMKTASARTAKIRIKKSTARLLYKETELADARVFFRFNKKSPFCPKLKNFLACQYINFCLNQKLRN